MTAQSKVECIKRLGMVLAGKVEPSVEMVMQHAQDVVRIARNVATDPLHALYDSIVNEPLPDDTVRLLRSLGAGPKHFVPPGKGGQYAERPNQPD